MELIDRILDDENIEAAIRAVQRNQGAPGIDKMPVGTLKSYFAEHGAEIKEQIRAKKYQPQPVRRVYIPKANGKQRPLGIPTVVDRVIQQAVAQVLSRGYERYFSDFSHGFRPNRSCHTAMEKALEYLNEGYDWVIDLDIEKYFDTVNHDKLISILRERISCIPAADRKCMISSIITEQNIRTVWTTSTTLWANNARSSHRSTCLCTRRSMETEASLLKRLCPKPGTRLFWRHLWISHWVLQLAVFPKASATAASAHRLR